MPFSAPKSGKHISWLHVINAVLSVYVLTALLIDTLYTLPPEEHELILMIDHIICAFFMLEFIRDFYRAPDKLKFMKWGWIDLLSSIPNLEILREGRLIRIIRIIRIIRAFRDFSELFGILFRNKVKGTFSSALLFAIMCWIFAALTILIVEQDPNSNIKTASDALWWAYVTITTVGYGDRYPVTNEGRIIAAGLMTVGVGLFGTLTGYLASLFVTQGEEEQREEAAEAMAEKELELANLESESGSGVEGKNT